MDGTIENKQTQIFNRDQVLSQLDELLTIQDDSARETKTSEFVDSRLKLLTENSVARKFSIMSPPRKGFIHPDSGIRRNFLVEPFHVDDPEIYRQLIMTFKEFKENDNWKGRTLREIAPYAIVRAIGTYFGNHYTTDTTENNNRAFYMDRSGIEAEDIHLKELKGKEIAVCAEKAATAQNLLSFLGYESDLVASSKCRLQSPDQDDEDGHMYNIITSGDRHLIFDPSNSVIVKQSDDEIYTVMPAIYPVDEDGYKGLMNGGQVQVTHQDGIWDGEQTSKGPAQTRIYGGPNPASV